MDEIIKGENEKGQGQTSGECLIKGQIEEEDSSKRWNMSNGRRNEDDQNGLNHRS